MTLTEDITEALGYAPKWWTLTEDGEPVATDFEAWVQWQQVDANVTVRLTRPVRGVRVSTVFLGGLQLRDPRQPLFETMIFGGLFNGWQVRARTRAEALRHHGIGCRFVEQFRDAPRKTRKVLRKYANHTWPIGPRELDRLAEFLRRVGSR